MGWVLRRQLSESTACDHGLRNDIKRSAVWIGPLRSAWGWRGQDDPSFRADEIICGAQLTEAMNISFTPQLFSSAWISGSDRSGVSAHLGAALHRASGAGF